MSRADAERALHDGDLDGALRHLQEEIRRQPANAELRVFLFQLLCVGGQWERANTQLSVAGELDAATLTMVQMYREAIRCELLRRDVFAGQRSPMVFGEPDEWMALLVEAVQAGAAGRADHARGLRERAFELAPTSRGAIDGHAFEWIADGDMRLGPVCEAIISGRYYWVPYARLSRIALEAPVDLRDVVWMPAHFQFVNGGESVGVIPTRYPGSEASDDLQVRLSRKTLWHEEAPDVFTGLGQRMLTTDAGEYAVMDVRSIVIEGPVASDGETAAHA